MRSVRPQSKVKTDKALDGDLRHASVIQILEIKGYIPPETLGAASDVADGLKDIAAETYNNLKVFPQFDLDPNPLTRNRDIEKLSQIIRSSLVEAGKGVNQRILCPLNNGRSHFLVLDILLDSEGNIAVNLVDSKKEIVGSNRTDANGAILEMALKAADKARTNNLGLAAIVADGQNRKRKRTGELVYTNKQKNNNDCPYHAIQYILEKSAEQAPRDLKPSKEELSPDFSVAKLEIIKRIARNQKRNDLVDHIKYDRELGIPYLDNHPGFQAKRPALLRANEGTPLTAGGKNIYDSVSAFINSKKDTGKNTPQLKRILGANYAVYDHLKQRDLNKGNEQETVYETLAKTEANQIASRQHNLKVIQKHKPKPAYKNAWEQMIATTPNAGKKPDTVQYGPKGNTFFVTKDQVKVLDEKLMDELRGCTSDSEVDAVLATNILSPKR